MFEIRSKFLKIIFKKRLTKRYICGIIYNVPMKKNRGTTRWCGSMAEQLICNQQVDGSTPFTSSKQRLEATVLSFSYGGFPERPKGADCKSVVTDFGGPNPPSPTKSPRTCPWGFTFSLFTLHFSLTRGFGKVINNSE